MEKRKFEPREEIPEKGNKWYTRKGYCNGVSPCIAGKPLAWKGSALGNCSGYAWGRFCEEHNEYLRVGHQKNKDWPSDAVNWWKADDGFERGQQIRLGAVAVWEKNGKPYEDGHVAIVERIVNKGTECFLSDSVYGGAFFRYYPFTSDMKKAGYKFLGFIYPKYDFYIEKSVEEVAKEVIDGKWGVQPERQKKLEEAGYDYYEIQNKVNEILWEERNYYTVQQGDTLAKIGKKVGVPWRTIMKLNNMKWTDLFHLYKGQKLRIR